MTVQQQILDTAWFWLTDFATITGLMAILFLGLNYVRTRFSMARMTATLQDRGWAAYPLAVVFGILSPFCSCSTIPLFISFLSTGVSLGPTITFLLTSPLVNLAALPIMWYAFGSGVTLLYLVLGVAIAVTAGLIIQRLPVTAGIDVTQQSLQAADHENRLSVAWQETKTYLRDFTPYVLAGTGVGALIHAFVPPSLVTSVSHSWWAIPATLVMSVPVYTNVFGVIPVAEALLAKGGSIAIVVVFMMGAAGLSVPEFIMLSKVMDRKLLTALIATVSLGILVIGLVLAGLV